PGVVSQGQAAWAMWFLGYPDQALKTSRRGVTLAEKLGYPFGVASALQYAAMLHQLRREAQAARERTEAEIALTTEHGMPFWLAPPKMGSAASTRRYTGSEGSCCYALRARRAAPRRRATFAAPSTLRADRPRSRGSSARSRASAVFCKARARERKPGSWSPG